MPSTTRSRQSSPSDIATILPALRARLRDAAYTPDALQRLLGITYPDDVGALNHAPALERLRDDRSPAATLTRLFFLEAAQPRRAVATLLSRPLYAALVRSRLVQERGAESIARLRIDPVGAQHILGDRRFRRYDRGALGLGGSDPVYPPSSDSLMLRDAVRAPAGARILDLCTGSGIQALAHAPGGPSIAVDINPRAAQLARYNAAFNGVETLEVRRGDLYAPVRGEHFDVIIANPPFVASPYATGPSYHAGGPTGDRVLRRIIAGFAMHLRPAGRAFAISHIALRAGDDLARVARVWFRGFPGRAAVFVVETGTPVDLAAAQALFALDRGVTAYAREVRRWVDYLRRHRVASVSVILVVAARTGSPSVEIIDAQPRVFPMPLAPAPTQRVGAWLEAGPVAAAHAPAPALLEP